MTNTKAACPEWQEIGMGNIGKNELFRHFLFMGETGSGKTKSGILPLCRLAFDNEGPYGHAKSAGLVVDPKSELGDQIEQMQGVNSAKHLIRIKSNGSGPVLWHFEQKPLDGLGATEISEHLLSTSDSFSSQITDSKDSFWIYAAKNLLTSLITIDLTLWSHPNGKKTENIRTFWKAFSSVIALSENLSETKQSFADANQETGVLKLQALFETFKREIREHKFSPEFIEELLQCQEAHKWPLATDYRPDNYIEHLWQMLGTSMKGISVRLKAITAPVYNAPADAQSYQLFWLFFIGFTGSWNIDGKAVFNRSQTNYFYQFTNMADSTYSSIFAVYSSFVSELCLPEFCSRISLNPFEAPRQQLKVKECINKAKIVIYEPQADSSVTAIIGRTIKSAFFSELLTKERLNNPSAIPFFYICDEFQRFITRDRESGEQSLLDRCRAYNVCCGLATQSIASLRHVYPSEAGHQAIKILMINTGNKLFFRTIDNETDSILSMMLPHPSRPGKPHVLRVRPLASLKPGECYYLLSNSTCGRGQINISTNQPETA